jgi:hypothetical protein
VFNLLFNYFISEASDPSAVQEMKVIYIKQLLGIQEENETPLVCHVRDAWLRKNLIKCLEPQTVCPEPKDPISTK